MIDGGSYYNIYLIIITIYTIYLSNKYSRYQDAQLIASPDSYRTQALWLTVFMALFIGLRPKHKAFVDMNNYIENYGLWRGHTFQYDVQAENRIFDNLFAYMSSHDYDITLFFLIIAIIYFGGIYISSRKLFPKDTLYGIVIYLAGFSTFTYATNGIKAGAAAIIFLCALAYYKKRSLCVVLLLASIGFHHSMILPVVAFVICYFYNNLKIYLGFWCFALIIALSHITYFQNLFGGMVDEQGALYLLVDELSGHGYITGFRLDFVIYGFFPIAVGYYAIFKHGYKSRFYTCIYCTYVLVNAIWMLCMYASFTNRIAYLSWLMLPYVLVYPFFDKKFVANQYKKLNNVVWGQLGFTLFMRIVYYGLLK